MKILLVDDHAVVRQGYRRLLEEVYPGLKVSEASNAAETLTLIGTKAWDLVIVDINMPGRDGFELIKDIRALKAKLPVLVSTMHNQAAYAVRSFKAGAIGFLTKDSPPEELYEAIQSIRLGKRYVPQRFAEALATSLSADSDEGVQALSNREFHVLGLLGQGKSVGQIASDLGLSEKTVSTYRARLLQKLGLVSTAELIRYAIQNNIDT